MKNRAYTKMIIGVLIGLVFLGGVGAWHFFSKKPASQTKELPAPTPKPVPASVHRVIQEVKKKVVLPADETPSVATVTDLSKLDQAFFANAQIGDKVLIFIGAKKAMLYRPRTDEIVHTGTLEIVSDNASGSADLSATDSGKQPDGSILRVRF